MKPVEMTVEMAQKLVEMSHGEIGEMYAMGGTGFDNELVVLFIEDRALLVPQELMGATHEGIGCYFNPTDPLVKEFKDLQDKEAEKYYKMLQD